MDQIEIGKKYYKEITLNGEKLNKWLVLKQITKFDENLNDIYVDNGFVEWFSEYDNKGNKIYVKETNKYNHNPKEYWYDYDSNSNCIHMKNSDGLEKKWDCTIEDDILKKHLRSNYSVSLDKKTEDMILWYSNGKLIYRKDNLLNIEKWCEYDSHGNRIKEFDSKGNETHCYYELNDNKNIIKVLVEGNTEESSLQVKNKWDCSGWTLHKNQEMCFEYDDTNRLCYCKEVDEEFWYLYEIVDNQIVQYKYSNA